MGRQRGGIACDAASDPRMLAGIGVRSRSHGRFGGCLGAPGWGLRRHRLLFERLAQTLAEGVALVCTGLKGPQLLAEDAGAEVLATAIEELDQVLVQVSRRFVAVGRIERHGPLHNGSDFIVHGRCQGLHRCHIPAPDPLQGVVRRVGLEGVLSGQAFVQQDAGREHIGSRVEGAPHQLLGSHVRVLALHHPKLGHRLGQAASLGDAKVCQLDLAFEAEQHVLRRDVAVDDVEQAALVIPATVRIVEAFDEFAGDVYREFGGHLLGTARQ